MASFDSRVHPASSHIDSHALYSSVCESVHGDSLYDVDGAFIRMDLAHPGPGPSPDPRGDYSSYDSRLHLEQEFLNDYLAAQPPSPTSDDAAVYTYGPPASLSSTPEPGPHSQYAYDQWYPSPISSDLQSDFDMHQHSSMSVDPWATRDTVPVQSAYSTIADALGYCPTDVYTPAPPSACTMAPSRTAKVTVDTSGCQTDSTAESRKRKSSRICEQAASQAPPSYPSPAASSSRHGSKPKVISTPRRNIAVSPNTRPAPSTNPLQCPFCSYEARHGRVPDIKRHLLTHTRGNKYDFLCCGVPLAQAEVLGVPAEVKREEPLVYEGIEMVGGCWKGFSRRDALARHLRSTVGKCLGDARAPYLLGNQRGH